MVEMKFEKNTTTNFYYSIVLMNRVDADYTSLWACARPTGSVNDACTFQDSQLY